LKSNYLLILDVEPLHITHQPKRLNMHINQ